MTVGVVNGFVEVDDELCVGGLAPGFGVSHATHLSLS